MEGARASISSDGSAGPGRKVQQLLQKVAALEGDLERLNDQKHQLEKQNDELAAHVDVWDTSDDTGGVVLERGAFLELQRAREELETASEEAAQHRAVAEAHLAQVHEWNAMLRAEAEGLLLARGSVLEDSCSAMDALNGLQACIEDTMSELGCLDAERSELSELLHDRRLLRPECTAEIVRDQAEEGKSVLSDLGPEAAQPHKGEDTSNSAILAPLATTAASAELQEDPSLAEREFALKAAQELADELREEKRVCAQLDQECARLQAEAYGLNAASAQALADTGELTTADSTDALVPEEMLREKDQWIVEREIFLADIAEAKRSAEASKTAIQASLGQLFLEKQELQLQLSALVSAA